jgi:hypothetical protein
MQVNKKYYKYGKEKYCRKNMGRNNYTSTSSEVQLLMDSNTRPTTVKKKKEH